MKSKKAHARALPVRVTSLAVAAVAALGSFTSSAFGADATTEELVVSATRRDTSVQDVPYNISALSGNDIDSLQLRDLSDIARLTPGLYQIDQGNRDANQLVMRGVNASAIGAPELLSNSQGDRVSTYYGETPVYINLAPIDLNRVEVLRGPQGTLYGARSLGGTLKYIPNKADTSEFTVDGHARFYSMSESNDIGNDLDAVINVPLIDDTLAFRAVLARQNRPGFIDQNYLVNEAGVSCPEPFFSDPDCTSNDLRSEKDTNDEETTLARFSLLWNVTDDLEADLSWLYQNQDIGGRQINTRQSMAAITDPNTLGPLETGNYVSGMRFLEPNDRDNNIYNLTLTYAAPFADIVSSTSYNTYEETAMRDQTDLLLLFGFGDFPAFSAFTNDLIDEDTFTQEVRLVSNDESSRFDWIAGIYYSDADFRQVSREFAPGYPDFAGAPTPNDEVTFISTSQQTKELALFGELGYQITDRWHILGGARWFDIDDDLSNCFEDLVFDPGLSCDMGDGSGDDVLYKLSTDFKFTDTLLGYALFSQGISLGGVNAGAGILEADRFIDPESVNNYEIGIRSTWMDGALTANGALFFMDWTDLQLESTSSNFLPIIGNGGGAETKGLELEINAVLNDNWSIFAGYAYTQGELTDSCVGFGDFDNPNKSCPIYGVDTLAGDRLPGFPEHQGSLGVRFDAPLQNGQTLTASYRLSAQSDVYTKLGTGDECCRDSGESLPGFTVHSATIGLAGEQWEATLFANNLFNKYAETGVRGDTSFIGSDFGPNDFQLRRYFKNVITPRIVGIDLRYRFK